jgi:ABC-type sugar transport system ATPase subunit
VLVLSEPTRGIDVGAKDDVVKTVRGMGGPAVRLAHQGAERTR